MNYVRKLGFEENPDYDFLRELFTKALKAAGEDEDGVYDWMLLNGGKGWEASVVRHAHACHHLTTWPLNIPSPPFYPPTETELTRPQSARPRP